MAIIVIKPIIFSKYFFIDTTILVDGPLFILLIKIPLINLRDESTRKKYSVL